MSDELTLLVVIGDAAAVPQPLFLAGKVEQAIRGTAIDASFPADGGTPPYTFSVASGTIPAGTTLDTATGQLVGTPTTQAYYEYEIEVTDGNADTDSAVFSLTIGGAVKVRTIIPAAEDSIAYDASLNAVGGATPYVWTLPSGSLPAGMSLVGDTITGTPSNATNLSTVDFFTLRATEAGGNFGEADFSIITWPPPFVSSLHTTIDTETFVGANYLGQIGGRHGVSDVGFGAGGVSGGPTLTYSIANGPPGIVVNSSTGELSGIPTSTGQYAMDIDLVDALGGTYSTTANISVFAEGQMKKYTATIGDGIDSDITVTHNFNSTPYAVYLWDMTADPAWTPVPVVAPTPDTILLSFKSPPGLGQYEVKVIG